MTRQLPSPQLVREINDKLAADGSRYDFHDVWQQYLEFIGERNARGSYVPFELWLDASGWMDE